LDCDHDGSVGREGLAANNVRHILNVATGIPNAFPGVPSFTSSSLI
jgi:hypothetical protein